MGFPQQTNNKMKKVFLTAFAAAAFAFGMVSCNNSNNAPEATTDTVEACDAPTRSAAKKSAAKMARKSAARTARKSAARKVKRNAPKSAPSNSSKAQLTEA